MRVTGVHIDGIGTASVGTVTTAEAVERGWYEAAERERTGLRAVTVAGATPAPDLAVQAARAALAMSRHAPVDFCAVFHTNVHPQGPDGWSAQHYVNRNTINQPVTSVEVRNGCAGFFSALQLALCYLAVLPDDSDRTAVLLTGADNFGTPTVDRWRASNLFVLADGGGAVVLSKQGGFAEVLAVGAASDPGLEERHRSGEELFPPGLTVGGRLNFAERTRHFQRRVADGLVPPGDFGARLVDTVERTLGEAGATAGDITAVVHDGYARDAMNVMYLEPLGFEEKQGIWDFTRRTGHAGPVDQIRGLDHLWRSGRVAAGDKVLMVSDAPGMEAACAVLGITGPPSATPPAQ
ncbi:ketoacyl-ACP synthase III family protein [Streptomyces sp. NPDC006668]|uniref:ketoacyl-ACP synthase III family protein n=1 Tax=Streptomyces sp. NPDC006668 TaxID=3156903 RepID=UPI001056BD26